MLIYRESSPAGKLKERIKEEGIRFVHGTGKRKTLLQRAFEQTEAYIEKLTEYESKLHIMGDRNSYAKTDLDATYMRLKEDAMCNGQLKPAYNVQYGSDSEFIVWAAVGPQATDTRMLIPFLKEMEQYTGIHYPNVVADAGYESEENYTHLEEQQKKSFIKPANYESSKKRKWKKDIGRQENMQYLEQEDAYVCANGHKLVATGTHTVRAKTGYESEKTHYICEDCSACPMKAACIHGNHFRKPLEERTKQFTISKKFMKQRADDLERFTSPEGVRLRDNRTIQAEGVFANIKADLGFRRFLGHGQENAVVTVMLLAMAYNIQKLHHKIQNETLGRHLIPVDKAA